MKKNVICLNNIVLEEHAGKRLDRTLALLYPDYSRERLKSWIISGECKIDGVLWRPKDKVSGGEEVTIKAELEADNDWKPEAIPLNIIFEDDELLVINKQDNFVVHPAAGNKSGTLVNALLNYCPSLQPLPRAGIVHRLDKDTTGLMVIAKSLIAHNSLVKQLQDHSVKRSYIAVVCGMMVAGGKVDKPIGRHPVDRIKMAVVTGGKPAVTHYRVKKKFNAHSLLQIELETGRTHQIRVHMAYIGYSIVGDKIYGKNARLPKNASEELIGCLQKFPRQALHAKELEFVHPITQKKVLFSSELPDDMQRLIYLLGESVKG